MAKVENKAPITDEAGVVQGDGGDGVIAAAGGVAAAGVTATDAPVGGVDEKARAKAEKQYRLTRPYVHNHTFLPRTATITLNARQAEFLLADGTIEEV